MASLAAACRWLVRLEARPWTTEEAARLAACDQLGARAYLRRLAGQQAVVEIETDHWRPGPRAEAWAKASREAKTREGGNSAAYRAAKALRESLAAEDWQMAKARGGDLTPPGRTTAHKCVPEDANDMSAAAATATDDLISYATAADRMGISLRSIKRLVAIGDLPVVRLGANLARVDPAEVAELIRKRTTRAGKAVER